MKVIEEDAERFDFREEEPDDARPDVDAVLEHLRDTLSEAASRTGYRSFHGREGTDEEIWEFQEELIAEAYNAGVADWDDPGAGEVIDWD